MKKEPKLTPLQQARKAAVDAFDAWQAYAKSLDATCSEDNRDVWTDEERAEYDAKETAFNEAKAKCETLDKQETAKGTIADAERWINTPAPRIIQPTNDFGRPIGDCPNTRSVPRLPASIAGYKTRVFTDEPHGLTANEKAFAFGLFARAVAGNERSKARLAEFGIDYRADMSESVNTAGGALVPNIFVADIIRQVLEYGVFRRNADVRTMTSEHMIFPVRTAGLTAYFPGENVAITESQPTYTNATVTAKKVATLTPVSNELLSDAAISLADQLAREVAFAFANTEDSCGFLGDGTSTYGGMVGLIGKINDGSHTGSVYTAITGNTAYSTLDLLDFQNMIGQLPRLAGIRPVWYMHPVAWAAAPLRLLDAGGGNTVANLAGPQPMTFLGYPVELVNVMNSTTAAQVSAQGGVLLGDISMSAIMGTRADMSFAADSSRFFDQDQTAFRGITRFGIDCHMAGYTTTASSVICLNFPGS